MAHYELNLVETRLYETLVSLQSFLSTRGKLTAKDYQNIMGELRDVIQFIEELKLGTPSRNSKYGHLVRAIVATFKQSKRALAT